MGLEAAVEDADEAVTEGSESLVGAGPGACFLLDVTQPGPCHVFAIPVGEVAEEHCVDGDSVDAGEILGPLRSAGRTKDRG